MYSNPEAQPPLKANANLNYLTTALAADEAPGGASTNFMICCLWSPHDLRAAPWSGGGEGEDKEGE